MGNSEKLSKGPGRDLVGRERGERGRVGTVRGRDRLGGAGREPVDLRASPGPQTGGLGDPRCPLPIYDLERLTSEKRRGEHLDRMSIERCGLSRKAVKAICSLDSTYVFSPHDSPTHARFQLS